MKLSERSESAFIAWFSSEHPIHLYSPVELDCFRQCWIAAMEHASERHERADKFITAVYGLTHDESLSRDLSNLMANYTRFR